MGVDDNFNEAIAEVLEDEGGYVNNPNDKGGETNFGISKRSYPTLDIKSLTMDDAKKIYKRDYWDPNNYGEINDPMVSSKVFNLSVNMGSNQINKLLQKALVSIGYNILVDGDIGPVTLKAINSANSTSLIVALEVLATNYYKALVSRTPSYKEFIKGWLNRVYD